MFLVRRSRFISLAVVFLAAAATLYFSTSYLDKKSAKEDYVEYITNHPFANRNIDYETYKSIPKKDRPDLAAEHNFMQIVDPILKRVPSERLVDAYDVALEKLSKNSSKINFRKSTNPNGWISQGPADKLPNAAIPNVNWTERGPDNVGGRTRSLMWDPNDPNTTKVWAGSVSGGLWFNDDITDPNSSWIAVDDFLTSLSISSITYDPTDPDVYYVGTGEGYIAGNGGGGVPGAGLYKSSNGGTTWNLLASTTGPDFRYIQKVAVTPSGTVIISTRESINEGGQPGIYRSTDGGDTWSRVLEGRAGDVELASNGDIYAAIGIGTGSGTLHRSTDDGLTWTDVTPSGGSPLRIELDVAPSASSATESTVIYAVAQDANNRGSVTWFQRSDDGGATWTDLDIPLYRSQSCTTDGTDFTRGQAFYDLIVTVKPDNSDILTVGGINVLRSSNAGVTTEEVSYWTGACDDFVHADQHEAVFRPGFPNEAIFGHDGGVSYSPDFGSSASPSFVTRNKNYRVTQFYSVAADNVSGSGYFLAGSQDNGTQKFTAANGQSTTEATGGDGGFTHIDQTDRNYQVTSYIGNTVFHSTNGGNSFSRLINNSGVGLFINPTDWDNAAGILYSAGDNGQLLRLKNINTTSPDAQETLNLSVGQISHIRANANQPNRIFVGSRQGDIYRIDNADAASPTVTNITNNITSTGNVSSIDIGSTDNQLIATFSNYGVVSVWLSTDGGDTWVSKDESAHGLPDIPVRWSIFNPKNTSQVLLATELGIWSTNDILADNPGWEPSVNNLANVRCDMLQYREADQVLVVATFGRGVFTSDVFSSINDTDPPVIVSLNPEDDSNENLLDINLEVSFNEPIQKGSGTIEIRRSSDDSLFESIDISNTNTSSSILLINPTSDFEPSTDYYIVIDNGAIVDNSGNAFTGISSKTVWNFETFDGDFPPTVQNPIADVRALRQEQSFTVEVDLSNVFTDVDNDDAAITKDVTINTNPALVGASVNGDIITLNVSPNMIGVSTLTVEANSNGKTVEDIFILEVGDAILFDQTDGKTTSSVISMQITDRSDSIVQSADDFIVPDGKVWSLTAVNMEGVSAQGSTINEFRVEIYGDSDGSPDDSNLVLEQTVLKAFIGGQENIRLPIEIDLIPGRYWLSVIAISALDDSQFNWRLRQPNIEGEFHINDRLGFFEGLEPDSWLSGSDIGAVGMDLIFDLEGDSVTVTRTPGGLSAEQTSKTEVTIRWIDNSDNETGFSVERSSEEDTGFVEIATVGAGSTSYIDEAFETNKAQYYRVRALSDINSAFTEVDSIFTIPAPPVLNEVEDFINNSFTVSWTAADGANNFELDVSDDNFNTFLTDLEGLEVNDVNSFEVTNVENGVYQFRVRAFNDAGVSENSEVGLTEVITNLAGDIENTFRFQLYPVPTKSSLNIKLPNTFEKDVDLKVYNLKGNLVYQRTVAVLNQKEISFSTDFLREGIYMITLSNNTDFSKAKFIKVN